MDEIKLKAMQPMTVGDRVALTWTIPYILLRILYGFSKRCVPLHRQYRLNWRQKLGIAFVRAERFSLNQRQAYAHTNSKTSGQRIREYCKEKKLDHREVVVPIPAGTINTVNSKLLPSPILHFIGLADADPTGPTVLFAHGGGYLEAIVAEGHVPLGQYFAKKCKAKNLVFLEYTLMPEVEYPAQLIQMTEAVRYLIEDEKVLAEDLVFGGDSAGGHIIASLLAHVAEPAPTVEPLDLHGHKFGAAVMISPWLVMPREPKHSRNAKYDIVQRSEDILFAKLLNTNRQHVWAEPMEAPDAKTVWNKIFPPGKPSEAIIKKMLITSGDAELIFDECQSFAADYVKAEIIHMDRTDSLAVIGELPFVFAIGRAEVHDQPVIDIPLQYEKGDSVTAIGAFLESLKTQ